MIELEKCRKEIESIDAEMAELFEKRMDVAKDIAIYKKEHALPVEDKKRESELLQKNSLLVKNEEYRDYYALFFHGLLSASKSLQSKVVAGARVGYCGVPGAYGHIASMKACPGGTHIAYPTFDKAYHSVLCGENEFCVLPIENSYAGDVGDTMDLVFSGELFINRMITLKIEHSLMGVKGTTVSDIKTVMSHPQALAQCDEYISSHSLATIEMANTAIAAKRLAENPRKDIGVIASPESADIYGLEVLARHINTSDGNTTRFAVFSRARAERLESTSQSTFAIVFTVKNESGALAKTLNIIGSHGFNMRNLRSRPSKTLMWSYYFFVELEGDAKSEEALDMMNELKTVCDRLKLAGSYSCEE